MTDPITFVPRQTATLPGSAKFPFDLRVLPRGADRREVFGLRYRAYRDAWGIPLDPQEQYCDSYDDLESTVIVAAYDAGQCIGTLRVNFSHPWQSAATMPSAQFFPDVSMVKKQATGTIVEVSRLAIDPAITNTSYRTTLYASLLRAAFMVAHAAGVSMILLAAKSDLVRFYQYMLGFKTIGETGIYPPVDVPVALLGGTFGEAQKYQRAQNAFFKITDDEIASMKAAIAPALAMPVAA